MKKKLMIAVSCMMLVANVQVVAASGNDQGIEMLSDDGRAVESVFYTEDGEMIVNYTDFQVTVDELGVTERSYAKSKEIMTRGEAPVYDSTLQPVNDYSYLWAYSHASYPINKMIVSLTGYRDNGYRIGTDRQESPDGWEVGALSAYVKPLDLGLNYKVGKGESYHFYSCTGYQDYDCELTWEK